MSKGVLTVALIALGARTGHAQKGPIGPEGVAEGHRLPTEVILAPPVRVKEGHNPVDGETWVQISVNSKYGYARAGGAQVIPVLKIQCSEKSGNRKLDVLLVTGGVHLLKSSYKDSGISVITENKIDDGKPTARTWSLLPDFSTLQYAASLGKSKNAFVKDLLDATFVYIEFRPSAGTANVVAQFDVSEIQEEFFKHHQCIAR